MGNTKETDNGNVNESIKKILKISKKAGNENENKILKRTKKAGNENENKKKTMNKKNNNISRKMTNNGIDNTRIKLEDNNIKNEEINKAQEIIKLKDFELNALDYEEAIKLDHRGFFIYYISLIKNNHPLLFSFAPFNDYNSIIIKMFLFFFSFSLDLSINALFFDDETMHVIYEDKGEFNFFYQIPQIIYSSIISKIIDGLIRNLALSQDTIVGMKEENNKKNLDKIKLNKILKCLKIKFTFFFIISFMILSFFWFFVTCFCGIYVNTQMHLLIDSAISLIVSLLMPFVTCIIPCIFRRVSLNVDNPTRGCLFKFAGLVENYLV